MDERIKQLNNKIARLRQAYDQSETTAELLLEQGILRCGGDQAFHRKLSEVADDKRASLQDRSTHCLAQFGVMRLLLNEAEREHADLLLGIDPAIEG